MTDEIVSTVNLSLIEVTSELTVAVKETTRETLEFEGETLVIMQEPDLEIVASGEQGPPGPPGPQGASAGEEMPYAEITDFVGEDVIYRGQAVPGSAESASVWRIKRLDIDVDGDVKTTWAGGVSDFLYSWANRATYTYS